MPTLQGRWWAVPTLQGRWGAVLTLKPLLVLGAEDGTRAPAGSVSPLLVRTWASFWAALGSLVPILGDLLYCGTV